MRQPLHIIYSTCMKCCDSGNGTDDYGGVVLVMSNSKYKRNERMLNIYLYNM